MEFLNEVDARVVSARGQLAVARARGLEGESLVRALANAVYYATAAVLLAHGVRVAQPQKLRALFEQHVAQFLDAEDALLLTSLWEAYSGTTGDNGVTEMGASLIDRADRSIEHLLQLTTDHQIQIPFEDPGRHAWDELDESERKVLGQIARIVRTIVPSSHVFLYGSRAKRLAREESDYVNRPGFLRGSVYSELASRTGVPSW